MSRAQAEHEQSASIAQAEQGNVNNGRAEQSRAEKKQSRSRADAEQKQSTADKKRSKSAHTLQQYIQHSTAREWNRGRVNRGKTC